MPKPTLLCAEDNLDSREGYACMLESYFDTIYLASNGEEALALYREHQPDMLLLDISMPLLNGLEVVKRIRKENPSVPIVMLTAHSEPDKLLDAVNLKLDAYLLKPVDERKLIETVQTLTEQIDAHHCIELLNGLVWDDTQQKLYMDEEEIKLTKKERLLIHALCTAPGSYLTHDELIIHIWEDEIPDYTYNKKLVQLIYRLNKKIADIYPHITRMIENSYTLGYKIILK